jgi:hypothetical protein
MVFSYCDFVGFVHQHHAGQLRLLINDGRYIASDVISPSASEISTQIHRAFINSAPLMSAIDNLKLGQLNCF